MSRIEEYGIEELRQLLKENKPFNEIMTDVMKVGRDIATKVAHKDYKSCEEVMEDIKNHNSPLFYIDQEVITNFEDGGTNLIGVKKCPFKDIMNTMSRSENSDAKVNTVMDGFHTREGEDDSFVDLGCYVAQQLRQMIVSSLSVNGKYDLNYIHLGCDKGNGTRTYNDGDINMIGMDRERLDRLLNEVDCIYAISCGEGSK